MRIVLIASAGGSVAFATLPVLRQRGHDVEFVSDRECRAIVRARELGLRALVLPANSGAEFSDLLLRHYGDAGVELFVSFYTKLFQGEFLAFAAGRLINFHPSLLPACPGMHGFQDSVASRAHFLGSTVHFVDEGVDSGPPILQGVIPYDPHRDVKAHRHLVFLQQCKSLLQVVAWIAAGRLARNEDGRVLVRDARYAFSEFVPNLDSSDAIHFSIPEPKRFV